MTTKQVLRECSLFESLSDGEMDKVATISRLRDYDAGATVCVEGSAAEELFVVERGKVALQMQLAAGPTKLSKRITVDVVAKGEAFGWSAVVEPHRYTLMAVCLEPSRVMVIDSIRLRTLLQDDHRIGYQFLSELIRLVASRLDETRHVLISERMVSSQA